MPSRPGGSGKAAPARPRSVRGRKVRASERIIAALAADDRETALTAALETVADELERDPAMRRRLRARYGELEALRHKAKKPAPAPAPVPISGPDLDHFNPYAKPDPYKLLAWYGHDQFRALISRATPEALRDLVDAVRAREPDATPARRSRKRDMIDYIVEHVAGPGY